MKSCRGYSPEFRVNELDRLFFGRYGSILPDDDAGRGDAAVMLDHLAGFADFHSRADGFLNVRAPWMSNQECASMKRQATSSRKHWTASELGEHLRLQPVERSTYRTWSIRPVDANGRAWTADQLREERAIKARERARRARARAKGKHLLQRRPKVFDRARAVLNALPHYSARTVAWLITQVAQLPEFQSNRGKRPAPSSMPRLVKRAIDYLESRNLVATSKISGVRGELIKVSRNKRAMRTQIVPVEITAGQSMGSHRENSARQGEFAPHLEPDESIVRAESKHPSYSFPNENEVQGALAGPSIGDDQCSSPVRGA
jgi:hypothetical protein